MNPLCSDFLSQALSLGGDGRVDVNKGAVSISADKRISLVAFGTHVNSVTRMRAVERAAGKASLSMAAGAVEALGARLSTGLVSTPVGTGTG